jgi:uncharacterized membrane protein
MKRYPRELVLLIFVAIPFIYLAAIWNNLPERVPTHFGGKGQADNWLNRIELLYITTEVMLGTYLLFLVLPILVPKEKMNLWDSKYYKLRFVLGIFFSVLMTFCLYLSSTYKT